MLYDIEQIKSDLHATPDAEQDPDKEGYVYIAIRKALDYMYTTFPERFLEYTTIKPVQIQNNITNTQEIVVNGPTSFTATGKAYYFEVCGNGVFTVESDSGVIATDFSHKEYTAYKGFCEGNTTITFNGTYQFYVKNIAVYAQITSGEVEDIPEFSTSVSYDFLEMTKEEINDTEFFYPFAGFIKDKFEESVADGFKQLNDYTIEPNESGHVLRLDGYSLTEKRIYWRKAVPIVNESTTHIDIPSDLYNIVFLSQLAAQFLIDEQSPVYDRLGYDARTVSNMKQALPSAQNEIEEFVNEMGW